MAMPAARRARVNWDYVAGFIDGEGTLTFNRYVSRHGSKLYFPLILAVQKDPEPLRMIADFLSDWKVKSLIRWIQTAEGSGSYRLEVRGKDACHVVLRSLDHRLIVKWQQARVLSEFIDCRRANPNTEYDAHCRALDAEMRELNRRGGSGVHNSWTP